jgi:hypothetical protein
LNKLLLTAALAPLSILILSCARQGDESSPPALSSSLADSGVLASSWAVDPAVPGPNLPPVGRSVFDYVVGGRVPFPFQALVKLIERQTGADGAGPGPIKRVLIPLGRSLQRSAAAPEFFKYPRAVVAVDGEPAQAHGKPAVFLKDRLFLGYQEKAGVIEVISYNEAAGRFEFQVVTDYRSGGHPEIAYANRKVCTVCHQGHAPIFPTQLWDETNANPEIRSLLEKQGRSFYDFRIGQGVDVPNAIENAADRANLFSAYQRLWQEATGSNTAEAIRWRADAFTLLLQYRLTGSESFDHTSVRYRTRFLQPFAKHWQDKWPQGLRIPNADIPNRNPLAMIGTGLHADDPGVLLRLIEEQTKIPAEFEPSNRRGPSESWSASNPEDLDRVIKGLAGFLSESDVRDLDEYLFERARVRDMQRVEFHETCRLSARRKGSEIDRLTLDCGTPNGQLDIEGVLYLTGNHVTGGTIGRVLINGRLEARQLDIVRGEVSTGAGRNTVTVDLARNTARLHARLPDGRALDKFILSWASDSHGDSLPCDVTLRVFDDFSPVDAAVAGMVSATMDGSLDVFSSRPFRRASLISALYARLGLKNAPECCLDGGSLPPPRVATQ